MPSQPKNTMDTPIPSKDETVFYSAHELAQKLSLNVMTIYRYIKAGRLKAYKIGKEFRIEKTDFDNFLKETSTQ